EYPGGRLVGPGLVTLVLVHPLVGGRTHHDRSAVLDELGGRVERLGVLLVRVPALHGEQPLQRVVLVGDEPVQAGGGLVDGLAAHVVSPRFLDDSFRCCSCRSCNHSNGSPWPTSTPAARS